MQSEDKKKTKCVSYTDREKVKPKVKKTRSKRKEVTGEQMVAYMKAQEEMRKVPVPSMDTPRRQLKIHVRTQADH